MIIDSHQHVVAGPRLGSYQGGLLNSRGFHGKGNHGITPDYVKDLKQRGKTHIELLDEVGTDVALLSPRPYTMMHSEKPEKIVHWYAEATNDAIAACMARGFDAVDAVAKAKAMQINPCCIAILDPRGDLVALSRMDGALWRSVPISQGKAAASAAFPP